MLTVVNAGVVLCVALVAVLAVVAFLVWAEVLSVIAVLATDADSDVFVVIFSAAVAVVTATRVGTVVVSMT